jgi:hypothetical protein
MKKSLIPFRINPLLFFLLLTFLTACAHRPDLKAFQSDGCSLFPDRDLQRHENWCQCCVEHDFAYWKGGNNGERLAADRALENCILKNTGDTNLAKLVYAGVRAGGSPHFPTWYRWGYGWPYKMKPLSDSLRLKKISEKSKVDRIAIAMDLCRE